MRNKIRKVVILSDFSKPWNPGFYMAEGFKENNVEVITYDPAASDNAYHNIINIIEHSSPEMVLYIKDYGLQPEWLENIKRKGPLLVQWYIDPVIYDWLIPFVEVADIFFTMSEGLVKEFSKYNSKSFWLTQGFEPSFFSIANHKESDVRMFGSEVTFVGNLGSKPQYLQRRKYLKRILDEGFQLKWWGPKIPRKFSTLHLMFGKLGRAYGRKFIWGEEYAKVAKLSKIFLAFDAEPQIRKSMSARMYTAVGCGAFYMCRYVEGIEDVLMPDKEIVTFRNEDEMIDKIKFYLRNDALREGIAESGRRRVLKDHTYEIRIKQMLKIIEDVI